MLATTYSIWSALDLFIILELILAMCLLLSAFFFPKVFTPLKSMLVEPLIILPSADKSVSYDKFKRHSYGHLL